MEKKEKIPSDGVGYKTDIHEIVKSELRTQMRPFVTAVMHNNEEIRQGQKEQNVFLVKAVHHDTWIKALFAGQVFTAVAMFFHWIISS